MSTVLSDRGHAKERTIFGYSKHIAQEYDSLSDYANQKEDAIEKKTYANMKSGSLTMVMLAVIIMMMLLPALCSGSISNGLYAGLVTSILNLVQGMSWNLAGIMQGAADINAYLNDVRVFLGMEEKVDVDAEPLKIPGFQVETIEFRNVYFRYPGREEYVLKDCSFVLQGNKCYAVVGKNGAGKSTLTKLLTGLYEDYEGQILINGKNLREYQYGELKWMVSVVFQDFARYALSFRDNILVGNINHKNVQLLGQIIEKLDLGSCVQELPCGADSKLGKLEKDGVELSGGQWQRIAIARGLYRNNSLLILDEPAAAIGALEEKYLYEEFGKLSRNCTSIIVTHRLASAQIADRILVIKDGRIVQDGSHSELAAVEGEYKTMYELQRQWYK